MEKFITKFVFVAFLLITFNVSAQTVVGNYCDNFGACLNVKADSTFKFTIYPTDHSYFWSAGKWKINKKLLTLKVVLIYDTLHSDGKDSLILSADEFPQKIIADSYPIPNQVEDVYPDTFLIKKKKLLPFINGKVIRKKRKDFRDQKQRQDFFKI